ncbi:hypothetical protein P3X46_034443 [Hevea brasiliensis]|uniref:Cation efflux protein transmembrane domain-containing protein n=1 Tax=Hevea brasiliensis TaxID=3981 RepID=A0ABQ9KA65_HEVBR|nr:hypothetical protein P3X46_034443 [Hevea brasiliensis]
MNPLLSRTVSGVYVPPAIYSDDYESESIFENAKGSNKDRKALSVLHSVISILGVFRSGNRQMKRLLMMISLNVACSTAELGSLRGVLPDCVYAYGYKWLEVLAAFTNGLFLLFMSFSMSVETLHAFIQEESEHKHYLIVSAVTNLLINLIGVWFFRNYDRISLVYRIAEDMNYHSVCLHFVADSIRSAGLILASWFLSLGVDNAEVLCLGLVSVAAFMLVMPLFKSIVGIFLQMAPPSIPSSALSKCLSQITVREEVNEVSQAGFWELVPGHVFSSLSVQVKKGMHDRPTLQFLHGLYHDMGIQDLTLQTAYD